MLDTHAAVSRGTGCPPILADSSASTCRAMASALLRSHLPRRTALRFSSAFTNRIRFRPLGSLTTLAMFLLAFLAGLAAQRDCQLQKLAQGVQCIHRKPALPVVELR